MSKMLQKSFYLILLVFVAVFIVSSLLVRAQYNYALYGDNPILGMQQWSVFLPVILCFLVQVSDCMLC